MKRRTRHALLAMFDSPLNVELRNVDIASFYPTERYIQKLVLGIEPVQSGTGDPSPDNVRPITGHTGMNVYVSPTQDVQDATVYPISWQSEAGTVYAGYLSIDKDGNVTLTVTHVKDTFTKDSAWFSFGTGTGNSSAAVFLSSYDNCYYKSGISSRNGAISSTGKEAQNYWANNRQNELPPDGDMCFAYSESGALRFHRTDVANITDIESFKANFPDTEVLYKLKNPVTYTLSSVTPIATIRPGINNVWCDTGPVIELIS